MNRNPIISIAKESLDPHSMQDWAAEWLFQMCRLWTEHQSPLTGTCPVPYRDFGGPLALEDALATGEDSAYWDAVLALIEDQKIMPHIDPEDFYTQTVAASWREGDTPEGYDPHAAFEHIRGALETFDRVHNAMEDLK